MPEGFRSAGEERIPEQSEQQRKVNAYADQIERLKVPEKSYDQRIRQLLWNENIKGPSADVLFWKIKEEIARRKKERKQLRRALREIENRKNGPLRNNPDHLLAAKEHEDAQPRDALGLEE